jgi:hypothetical protein
VEAAYRLSRMPLVCGFKQRHGREFCVSDCPASAPCGVFEYVRVERSEDVPPVDARAIDVAVLDMNHGFPNLGHDSLVHAVLDASCEAIGLLEAAGLRVRVLSYDVRRGGVLPEAPGGRHLVYVGTGGPGSIDPAGNDGIAPESQGVRENPAWEGPAFALFDSIRAHPVASLIAVCHTFGVLCRWSGAARPVLRAATKGKCSGVLENVLSWQAREHPWFSRLHALVGPSGRLRVVENRLFDLQPDRERWPTWAAPIGFETLGVGGPAGEAVTMIEFARDQAGVVPRLFAVNHHPEIVDRFRQLMILDQKRGRGEVSEAWYRERLEILTRSFPEEDVDQRLHLTSDFTLLGPLRFHLFRQFRLRAEAHGGARGFHEDRVLSSLLGEAVGARQGEVF